MNERDVYRARVFEQVSRGQMMLRRASELLGVSYRQAKRLKARYAEHHVAGLTHQALGRSASATQ
jgi:transposase